MNENIKLIFLSFIFLLFLGGCSTEIISEITPDIDDKEESQSILHIRVGSIEEESSVADDRIESLLLVFFSENIGKYYINNIVRAIPTEDKGLFKAYFPRQINNVPTAVTAIANYDGELNASSIEDILKTTTKTPYSKDLILMSSVRYYTEDLKTDCFFTPVYNSNILGDDLKPITIFLERGVAKVTVADGRVSSSYESDLLHNGSKVKITILLTGWDINATDKETFLIKNTGGYSFEEMESQLGKYSENSEWHGNYKQEEIETGVLHWALSPSYALDKYPESGDVEDGDINFLQYNSLSGRFYSDKDPGSVYVNESTRHKSVFGESNSLPAFVVAAQHIVEGYDAKTFYLKDKNLIFEDEYFNMIASLQSAIYYKDSGAKVNAMDLKEILEDKTPDISITGKWVGWNMICPQLSKKTDLKRYCDINGNSLETEDARTTMNRHLYLSCGLFEKFVDGKGVYSLPVRHFKGDERDEYEPETGDYGLVRNNHYFITIKSQSSMGHGIPDENIKITDLPEDKAYLNYPLGVTINVMPWIKVPQSLDF